MVASAKTVTDLIGNTPLLLLRNFSPHKDIKIMLKLEKFNPSGSIKDRAVKNIIESAEKKKKVSKKQTLIEASSGNTGVALAMIGAAKGYKVKIVLPKNASEERKKIIKAFGAEIVEKRSIDEAIEYVKELVNRYPEKYFLIQQYDSKENYEAHYQTAEEIWEQTEGEITHVVAGIGTSGTIMGIARKLKEKNEKIKIIGVIPAPGESIEGLKNIKEQIRPSIFKSSLVDEIYEVKRSQALRKINKVAKKEGILVGPSTGAALHAAKRIAKKIKKGVIVVISPDGGERYLSSNVFGGF